MKIQALISAGALLAWATTTVSIQAQLPGAPAVRIVTPQEGESFLVGNALHVCAVTLNFTNMTTTVEFFAGTNRLGVVTNRANHFCERSACITWNNAAPGAYTLTAIATGLAGISATSTPVNIHVVTNLPPLIQLVKPRDNTMILGPTNINLRASAYDPDGAVRNVAFYEGTNLLGVVTSAPPIYVTRHGRRFPIWQTSFSLTWSNVPPGSYSLTAVATDNVGLSTSSGPVQVDVVTNLPPLVRMVSPGENARFRSPTNIPLVATAKDADGSVTGVEFFSGAESLGAGTRLTVTNGHRQVQTFYSLTWSNVPPGSYTLTAVGTDDDGASGTSAPVHVSVLPPPPPTVSIVDPRPGSRFIAPAKVYIAAVARNFTNQIGSVQFLADSRVLGVKTNSWWSSFVWTNVPVGTYNLTAIAKDATGISATSAPVRILVTTNSPWRRH